MGLIFHTKESFEKLESYNKEKFLQVKNAPILYETARATAKNINKCTTNFGNVKLDMIKCETFDAEELRALLANKAITHLRIYTGIQEKGDQLTQRTDQPGDPVLDPHGNLKNTHYCLIIVPIIKEGTIMRELGEKDIKPLPSPEARLVEYGYPCPPICDPISDFPVRVLNDE